MLVFGVCFLRYTCFLRARLCSWFSAEKVRFAEFKFYAILKSIFGLLIEFFVIPLENEFLSWGLEKKISAEQM